MSEEESDTLYRHFSELRRAGISVSLIITLHKLNGKTYRKEFIDWLLWLDSNKISAVRIHLLENHDESLVLSKDETIEVLSELISLQENKLNFIKFDLFDEIQKLLKGAKSGETSCVWNGCDPYTTPAVQGVEGDGSLSNCPRMNDSGIPFLKGEVPGNERQIALARTEQSIGGCKGCRYISLCKGYCPGTSLKRDWRNRTDQCESLKFLFAYYESKLKIEDSFIQESNKEYLKKLGLGRIDLGVVPVGKQND